MYAFVANAVQRYMDQIEGYRPAARHLAVGRRGRRGPYFAGPDGIAAPDEAALRCKPLSP